MGKNVTGGNRQKKAKNSIAETKLEVADNKYQFYSKVNKKLGGGRFSVDVFIPEIKKKEKIVRHEEVKIDQIALLRGSLRKRARIDVGGIVLVSLREFEDRKVDIIHSYKPDEVSKLRRRRILPECQIFDNDVSNDINFEDLENDNNKFDNKKRNANYTSNYDLIPEDENDYEYNEYNEDNEDNEDNE